MAKDTVQFLAQWVFIAVSLGVMYGRGYKYGVSVGERRAHEAAATAERERGRGIKRLLELQQRDHDDEIKRLLASRTNP